MEGEMTRCLKCGTGYDHRTEKKCPKCHGPNPKKSKRWEGEMTEERQAILDLAKLLLHPLSPSDLSNVEKFHLDRLIDTLEKWKGPKGEVEFKEGITAGDLRQFIKDVPNHARLKGVSIDGKDCMIGLRFEWTLPSPDFIVVQFGFSSDAIIKMKL